MAKTKRRKTPKKVKIQQECFWCGGTGKARHARNQTCPYCTGAGFRYRHESLFLCIGGPHDGEFLNRSALGDNYVNFNNGGAYARGLHNAIWIHESILDKATYD